MFQYIKNGKSKVVVIKKYDVTSFCWSHLLKRTRGDSLSVSEIIQRYEGFEGELQYFSTLEVFESMNSQLNIEQKESLLFMNSPTSPLPIYIKNQTEKMGYDYGLCEGEQAVYSSIFNEVLFGTQIELLTYNNLLNKHLLFPSLDIASEYVKQHHELLLGARDVENDEEMTIYEIWKRDSK